MGRGKEGIWAGERRGCGRGISPQLFSVVKMERGGEEGETEIHQ